MKLSLLGVMGSVPGGSSDLGKNTTCLVIEDEAKELIIDAGTGILKHFNSTTASEHHVLFTHFHLDHIIGLPYVTQLYDKNHSFHFYGAQLNNHNTASIIPIFFVKPFLPINVNQIKSKINHVILSEKKHYDIAGFKVEGLIVDHPGKCMVYSVKKHGKKITVLTDLPIEHHNRNELIQFSKDSDILYIDGYITNNELFNYQEYGHSSIENAIDIFKETKSKKLLIGHHKNNRLYNSIKQYETDVIFIGKEDTTYYA